MIRTLAILLTGLYCVYPAWGQPGGEFEEVVNGFLAQAPMKITYIYEVTKDGFHQDTTGSMVIVSSGEFRLEFWDKVYGSDGSSLYLHDRNTNQTVVDSLRWTDLNLWVQLLQGELPAGTVIHGPTSFQDSLQRWELSHERPWWSGNVDVAADGRHIQKIELYEDEGWRHLLQLGAPERWDHPDRKAFLTLLDLPGIRLDLR
ncbi:MAG: hypothetical protein JSU61_02930 [Fidelibacterota bacterium]|nr:MAG: hypothetical protein JSU61_02930 [Candidatus Neomarinimicrobiota bacterium]